MNLRTPLATKVVGGVALLVIAALGWLLLVGPAWSAIEEADTARTDAADANMLLTTQLADLRAQAEDLTRTARSADELSRILPATADQPGFFADVTEAARTAGIDAADIDDLSPSVPVVAAPAGAPTDATGDPATSGGTTGAAPTDPSGGTTDPAAPGATAPADPSSMAFQTVSMSVSGGYPELQRFLANLETMPRALLLTGVTLTRAEGEELTLAVQGATFLAPPLLAPDSGGGTAGSDTADGSTAEPGQADGAAGSGEG